MKAMDCRDILYYYCSNGVAVEGADHHTVVQLIKKSGNTVRLSILSVTDDEKAKLEVESTPTPSSVEYYERRSVPIAMPSSEKKTDENGKEYVVSTIVLLVNCVYDIIVRYSTFIWLAD